MHSSVSIDRGMNTTATLQDNAIAKISNAVMRDVHFRVPTRPRRFSEHNHSATKEAGQEQTGRREETEGCVCVCGEGTNVRLSARLI